MLKQLFRSDAFINTVTWLIAGYFRLVYATSRFSWVYDPQEGDLIGQDGPLIFSFYHGRLAMMPFVKPRSYYIGMLISRHGDGEFIARSVANLGVNAIRGSSEKAGRGEKGGAQALREMVRTARNGQSVGITPDGPKGPCMQVSEGTMQLARLSGVRLLPMTYATSNRRILGSWDQFHFPLPFSKGVFVFGKSMQIPKRLDAEQLEAARLEFEAEMNRIVAEADRIVGRDPVLPPPKEGAGK